MVLKYDSLKVVIIIVFVIIIDINIYALEEKKETQTVWKYLQRVVTPHKPVELMLSYLPKKLDNLSSQVLKFSLWRFNNESFTIEQNVLTPTSILTNIETSPLIETSTSADDKINEQNVLTPTSILTNIETSPLIETSTSADDKINEQNFLTPTSILTNIETTPLIETSTSADDKINEFWSYLPNQEHASKSANINEPDSSFIEEAMEDFDKYDYLVNDNTTATTTTENNNATEEITLLYY